MSDLDTSSLLTLAGKRAAKPPKPQWRPLDLADLHHGLYLAADPSVDAFGLVLLQVTDTGASVLLAESWSVGSRPDVAGWEDLLVRVGILQTELTGYIEKWVIGVYGTRDVLSVHEMPPQGGGRLMRPETALMASYAFRCACGDRMIRLPMVARQSHARTVCGDGTAKKPVVHRALKETILPQLDGAELITNEGKRDALGVALHAALTRK